MSAINLGRFAGFNMWRTATGDPCVRPGMRRVWTPDPAETLVACFHVRNEYGDEVWTYAVTSSDTDGIILRILDENFAEWQVFVWAPPMGRPRGISHGVVEGQILIGSPDLPTLWGVVGSSVRVAVKIDSDNPGTTAINVPRGIVSTFCNRFVIANGRSLFFSDPLAADGGDARTFVGANQNQRPGIVYGLHEAGDALVVVTTQGTWGLGADASAVGIVGSNATAWRLLSHVSAHSFESSCVWRGRVYALTEEGYAPCDVETRDEVGLSDPVVARTIGSRIALGDHRHLRMFSTLAGPLVAAPDVGVFHRSDLAGGVRSWWAGFGDAPGDVVGLTYDHDESEMIAMSDGIYRAWGDCDGESAAYPAEDDPIGVLSGIFPVGAADNVLPRHIRHAGAVEGSMRILASVRGSQHEAENGVPDPFLLVIGVDDWGAEGKRWQPTPIVDAEIDFGDVEDTMSTREVSIELAIEGAGARVLPSPDLIASDSAPGRPSNKG